MDASRTALVTGASSGIGAATAEALAGAGLRVHVMARRADRLAALAERTGCIPHAADVRDPEALAAVVAAAAPEVLVLNAGRGGGFAGLADTSREELAATVETNVTAVLDLIRLALPAMIARGRGHLVLIGSTAALYPSVSAIYGGSKAAVAMIARNLRLELRGTGLRVTDIRPGRVRTEFYEAAIADAAVAARAKDTGIRDLSPADVAAAVLYAVQAPSHVNVSAIELQPVEQTYGGVFFDPVTSDPG
ncbi:MAG: SDR family NAD(P)-dependent oxidoreductase [Paracoccaceae bacterium]